MLAADALPPVREFGSIGTGRPLGAGGHCVGTDRRGTDLAAASRTRPVRHPRRTPVSSAATRPRSAMPRSRRRHCAPCPSPRSASRHCHSRLSTATPRHSPRSSSRSLRSRVHGTSAARCADCLPDPAPPARIQDPFGLRTLPQVQGAASTRSPSSTTWSRRWPAHRRRTRCCYRRRTSRTTADSRPPTSRRRCRAVASGVAQSAQLSLARLAMLCEPGLTGQTAFLSDGTPGASGVMVCEYVAASALGSLRALATPVALQTVTLSRGRGGGRQLRLAGGAADARGRGGLPHRARVRTGRGCAGAAHARSATDRCRRRSARRHGRPRPHRGPGRRRRSASLARRRGSRRYALGAGGSRHIKGSRWLPTGRSE